MVMYNDDNAKARRYNNPYVSPSIDTGDPMTNSKAVINTGESRCRVQFILRKGENGQNTHLDATYNYSCRFSRLPYTIISISLCRFGQSENANVHDNLSAIYLAVIKMSYDKFNYSGPQLIQKILTLDT